MSRQSQRKGKNTEQVNRPVSFNLLDPDQRADYEYTLSWFNFSGKVKEWIRSCRLGLYPSISFIPDTSIEEDVHLPSMNEIDAVNSLF